MRVCIHSTADVLIDSCYVIVRKRLCFVGACSNILLRYAERGWTLKQVETYHIFCLPE
jgi:hypothetical protein